MDEPNQNESEVPKSLQILHVSGRYASAGPYGFSGFAYTSRYISLGDVSEVAADFLMCARRFYQMKGSAEAHTCPVEELDEPLDPTNLDERCLTLEKAKPLNPSTECYRIKIPDWGERFIIIGEKTYAAAAVNQEQYETLPTELQRDRVSVVKISTSNDFAMKILKVYEELHPLSLS